MRKRVLFHLIVNRKLNEKQLNGKVHKLLWPGCNMHMKFASPYPNYGKKHQGYDLYLLP